MFYPDYPLDERQQHFLRIAGELAAKFAERAPLHDREGTFPFENFADIRAAGLPSLIVPERYGGWGGTLLDTVLVIEALAAGDGSTALSLTMHMQTLGSVDENRSWPEPLLEQVCRAAVQKGALINALASEPELGSPSRGGRLKTTVRPVFADGPGRKVLSWVLDGRKNFSSLSPDLDYMLVLSTVTGESEDGTERTGYALVPVREVEGVEIVETWDSMGMRSTGSHDVVFHNVELPPDHVLPARSKKDGTPKVNAWFALTVSAVYVGVATAALQAAARYAHERVPTALGKPIAELESIRRRLGQAELLIHQARTHLRYAADLWVRRPDYRVEMEELVVAAKTIATNNAVEAVDHAMRVVGGASMSRGLPLERYYRDVRAGLSHPLADDQAFVLLGELALNRYRPEVPDPLKGSRDTK
jgi:alkylation response protein AidB-like acyl-CoA dehydrogenase